MESNLPALSEAGGFIQQLQQLQQQMNQIQDALLSSQPVIVGSPHGSGVLPSNNHSSDAPRTGGSSWAEEMDRCDPPGGEEDSSSSVTATTSRAPRKVVEVSERTEQRLVRSFACLENEDCHRLADSFALPKVVVTKTPELDKIMAAQCSKSTKSNDQALARIQALNSDTLGPLTELLELLNKSVEEDVPDLQERVAYAVESAITLLGNAFAQMSVLRRQKVLEEYNKELLTFAQGRKAEFLKAAPELFGPKFPRDATEHLDQLAALQKAKASSSSSSSNSSGFRKPSSYHSSHHCYYGPRQQPQPYSRQGKGGRGHIKKVPKGPK